MADELTSLGLPAWVVDGPITKYAVGGAQLALVGADAVTAEHIVNGTPSLELAQAAKGRVPFHVVCETVKFTRESQVEHGYDRVPLALDASIATEEGLIAPAQMERHMPDGV
jgi:translation initiation factor 2B subunit (eIF-2B alpha/beta/delta family)